MLAPACAALPRRPSRPDALGDAPPRVGSRRPPPARCPVAVERLGDASISPPGPPGVGEGKRHGEAVAVSTAHRTEVAARSPRARASASLARTSAKPAPPSRPGDHDLAVQEHVSTGERVAEPGRLAEHGGAIVIARARRVRPRDRRGRHPRRRRRPGPPGRPCTPRWCTAPAYGISSSSRSTAGSPTGACASRGSSARSGTSGLRGWARRGCSPRRGNRASTASTGPVVSGQVGAAATVTRSASPPFRRPWAPPFTLEPESGDRRPPTVGVPMAPKTVARRPIPR